MLQFVDREIANLGHLHDACSSANRVATLVWTGGLAAARRIAFRASASLIPSISNRIRPGRTTQTHSSGAPLPLPIRVSCGFFVIGLSGHTPVHVFAPHV